MPKKLFDFLDKLSGPVKMSSTCSDPAFSTNAPAFVRHGSLRPASRDLSGDARSGNANQTVFEPGQTRIQKNSPSDRTSYLLRTLAPSRAG
jgi:hypothetical protein